MSTARPPRETLAEQFAHQMAADEAAGTSHEDQLVGIGNPKVGRLLSPSMARGPFILIVYGDRWQPDKRTGERP